METALVALMDDLLIEIDRGLSLMLIFLDLSEAFNTVAHEVLLILLPHHS